MRPQRLAFHALGERAEGFGGEKGIVGVDAPRSGATRVDRVVGHVHNGQGAQAPLGSGIANQVTARLNIFRSLRVVHDDGPAWCARGEAGPVLAPRHAQ